MNSEEYREIIEFLGRGIYPESTENYTRRQWNFKRKTNNYTLSDAEPSRLYKVYTVLLYLYLFI